jgi:hypothetical protein
MPEIAQATSGPTLSWDANPEAEQVSGYDVYEHVGSDYNLLTPEPIPATTYPLGAVPPGAHTYAVSALNIRGESPKSSEVTFPAAPSAPSNPRII